MPILLDDIKSSNTDDFKNYPAIESIGIDIDDILIGDDAIIAENDYTDSLIYSLRATYEALKADEPHILYEGFSDNAKSIVKWFKEWLNNFKKAVVKFFTKLYAKVAKFKFKAAKIESRGFIPVTQFTVKGYDYTFDYGNNKVPNIINDVIYKTTLAVESIKSHKENINVVVNRLCNELGNTCISVYRGMLVGGDFVDAEYFDTELFRHFHSGAERGDKKDIVITAPALRNYVRQVKTIQGVIKNCENDKKRLENDTDRIIKWLSDQISYLSKVSADSMKETEKALTAIYNHSNNIIKRVHFICAKYYSEKLHALNEAIIFYDYIMDKAQGLQPASESQDVTEYMKLEDNAFYHINESFNSDMVDYAISELYFLSEAWEAKRIVIEADNRVQVGINKAPITRRRVTGVFGTIKETIRKIIAFIMNALERFNQAVSDLLKSDVQWVIDNNSLLNNLPPQVLQTMTLNYTNYMHTGAHQRVAERNLPTNGSLRNIAQRIGQEAVRAKQSGNQLDGAMTCYKNYFPQLYKLDPNNWKNAALLYYRGGSNGSYLPPEKKRPGRGETVVAKGAECQRVIKTMTDYVLNYKQYASACSNMLGDLKVAMNEQSAVLDKLAKERSMLTNEADVSNATFGPEMYSILENDNIYRTDLASMDIVTVEGMDYIKEELGSGAANPQHPLYMTGARPTQQPQQAPQQNQNNANPNQNANNNQQQNNQQQQQQNQPNQQQKQQQLKQNEYSSDAARQLISAYQVCSSICTAKLTVCEEIERSYMRVLRGVAAAVHKYNGDTDQDRANRQYNQNRQNDRQAAQDERLQKIRYRNEQKKARRTGLIGGMKNILGV